ncbi:MULTISPECIES: hypothetical protein [unclassified Cupriavidus]|uniref:hypothetical protein n=1 Tax=unclassified Cupriavidus TaxID=2640874 RepID=UPI001C00149F|nr:MULTISPECIES: hypothetical protein [unclassified Cupriavidus]MCA3182632.1 hypothetical protein [Cupriavidus sp.]MCA3192998.1 hypothetical protein [Cupriavidus sp.]MCA3195850.1 hypothetical protein [Cupriavidus sp.]MCA3204751.1 hypothetical protein [Cupriavidus sp.]MCA3206883.1 hypothetical protein [Cupriavidus sp.]
MRKVIAAAVGVFVSSIAFAYTVTTTTTTTTTRRSDGSASVETTQTQSAPYSAGRCQRLRVDESMLLDQLRRTGWKLEQDGVRAELAQVQEEIVLRGC